VIGSAGRGAGQIEAFARASAVASPPHHQVRQA